MGKNKQKVFRGKPRSEKPKGKKDKSVFKVAGMRVAKSKNRAKPITSTLKKLETKAQTDARTLQLNAAFDDDVRTKLLASQKVAAPNKPVAVARTPDEASPPVDMDAALSDFAKL